ncbi:MAG: ABC transporter substrate-binding protein [Dehalococcoidia bacterium]|nr:ABC transporter substrate-binding protein [Dehalococcoidia bacterium]
MPEVSDRERGEQAVGRRAVLRAVAVGASGLGAAALFGCRSTGAPAAGTNGVAASNSGGEQKRKLLNDDLLALNDPAIPYPYVIAEPDTPPKRGGTLRHAWSYDLASLDPTKADSVTTNMVPDTVGDRLLEYEDGARVNPLRLKLRPGIATSWETSPDGLTLTFHLADKAKWQNKPPVNGRPFTAEDVRLVYERNRTTGVTKSYFDNVASVAALNQTTFQIKMKAPSADFPYLLAARTMPLYPMELIDGGQLAAATDAIGTGMWILTSIAKSSHVSFVRNPDYWQSGKPYLDAYEVKMVPDASARLAAFRVGQYENPELTSMKKTEADALVASKPDTNVIWSMVSTVGGTGSFFAWTNLEHPRWRDERVRQAMDLGLDRKRQVQQLYNGFGSAEIRELPWVFPFEKQPTTQAELGPYLRYDPAEAKKLLSAAGQENLTIDFLVSDRAAADSNLAFVIEQYRNIGVTLKTRTVEYASAQSQVATKQFPDIATGAFGFASQDAYYKDMVRTNGSQNYNGIKDPQIDQWASEQSTELDPAKRRGIQRKIWDLMGQKVYIPFAQATGGQVTGVWPKYVRNVWFGVGIFVAFHGANYGMHLANAWLDKDNPSGNA